MNRQIAVEPTQSWGDTQWVGNAMFVPWYSSTESSTTAARRKARRGSFKTERASRTTEAMPEIPQWVGPKHDAINVPGRVRVPEQSP